MISTGRSRACSARRCPCRTRSTSRRRRFRASIPSSRPPALCSGAMADFVMPILGADMEAGTLVAWRKKPGDRVERGEIVADVETDKGAIEVEIFTSGVIEKIVVEPGAKVPVGTVLAIVREDHPAPAGAPSTVSPPRPPAPTRVRIYS